VQLRVIGAMPRMLSAATLRAIAGARTVTLERLLGPATFSYRRFEGRLPSIHWEFAGMDVGCSILGDGPSVYIAHEPEGYPGLKADARAIQAREGKGARVDYVAWPESDAV
jgi:hypothetical protein